MYQHSVYVLSKNKKGEQIIFFFHFLAHPFFKFLTQSYPFPFRSLFYPTEPCLPFNFFFFLFCFFISHSLCYYALNYFDNELLFVAKAPMKKTSSASEPVYRRAEMILQSLAQTGQQLTKKNRGNDNNAVHVAQRGI